MAQLLRMLVRIVTALVMVVSLVVALPAAPARGATFEVNSAADTNDGSCAPLPGGDCTLREAINLANSTAGFDTINFALPGPIFVININSPLPMITEQVMIDGFSQPGA